MNQDVDFNTPGPRCQRCGREAFRIVDGLCPSCSGLKRMEEGKALDAIAMANTYWGLRKRSRRSPGR